MTFKPPLEQFKPDVMMSTEDGVALLDNTYKKHKHAFVFVRHGGFEETFLADNEADMNDWLAKLNYASTFRSAGVRMRSLLGSNYDGPKTRGMRRMDSDKSTQSVQTTTGEVLIRSGKLDPELARQIQTARRQIMAQKIAEAEEKLEADSKQLDVHLRNARHLQILAPIQSKTRERVVLAAGGMAAKIKWLRMEMWRTRCHKDILALDLDEEINTANDRTLHTENVAYMGISATTSGTSDFTKLDLRAGSLSNAQATPRRDSMARPSTQPSPGRTINMDDMFQSSLQASSPRTQHKAQGSWELPPLSFESTQSSIQPGSSTKLPAPAPEMLTHHSSLGSVKGSEKMSDLIDIATRLATPRPSLDEDEQELLIEAGLVISDSPSPKVKGADGTSDGEKEKELEKSRSPDTEVNDSKTRVRRSLHRTLREAHVPTHHRSKKGKDSASSVAMTEDALSLNESEGLTRGAGSFTVHGKKASVITFGSEWQDISPEERLKPRKSVRGDESKLSVPTAIEDEDTSRISSYVDDVRPTSTISISTTTTTTKGLVTGESESVGPDSSSALGLANATSLQRSQASQK